MTEAEAAHREPDSGWTEREMRMAAPTLRALREARTVNEALNVAALIGKVVVEREYRERLIGALRDG